MKDAIRELEERAESIEAEAHGLREATEVRVNRATREFRVLGGLVFIALVLLIITNVIQFNTLNDMNETQDNILVLVEFVRDFQSEREGGQSPELVEAFQNVREIKDLLCNIDDPMRQEACAALGR